MPPGVGALTEADGRNFMLLMDMSRYLVNTITQDLEMNDINDASRLRMERMDLCVKMTGQMWSYWHSAPAGPGVHQMLLEWCAAQQSSATSIRNRELGSSPRGGASRGQMTAALHLLASNELKSWPRQRLSGAFIFAKEASDGAALLVQLDAGVGRGGISGGPFQPGQTVYKVQGISQSLGDLLRSNGSSLPACLGLTLLPFVGSIVYDGTIRVYAHLSLEPRPLALRATPRSLSSRVRAPPCVGRACL